jgi:O-antigen ligase
VVFLLYFSVIIIAFVRCLLDPTPYYDGTRMTILVDYLINPLKFLLPSLMVYDGVRSQRRSILLLATLASVYFLLSLQVIRAMGFDLNVSAEALKVRAVRVIEREVGYHRVDMSMMLAGGSWALVAVSRLPKRKLLKVALLLAAGIVLVGQAKTGGRTGYVTWAVVGLALSLLRWHKLLPIIPTLALSVFILMPSVRERLLAGFGSDDEVISQAGDSAEITSGRTVIWPYVLHKVSEAPFFGYGRAAMERTGLFEWLASELNEVFRHPHNAYLEQLLDGGIIGLLCAMPVFTLSFLWAARVFRTPSDPLRETVGGVALALLLALAAGSVGGQTLYPREGVVCMWAAIGLAMRTFVDARSRTCSQASSDTATDCYANGA